MKRWMVWFISLLIAVSACVQMFILKYQVIDKEDELKAIHAQILADSRAIHMLEAEWAVKNDPDRLYQLVISQSQLKPLASDQVQASDSLPVKMAPRPALKPQLNEGETP